MSLSLSSLLVCFFFNDTAPTEIYTLSLHDALPISCTRPVTSTGTAGCGERRVRSSRRSEEHTSELQSRLHIVCRLLLEKKNQRSETERVLCLNQLVNLRRALVEYR